MLSTVIYEMRVAVEVPVSPATFGAAVAVVVLAGPPCWSTDNMASDVVRGGMLQKNRFAKRGVFRTLRKAAARSTLPAVLVGLGKVHRDAALIYEQESKQLRQALVEKIGCYVWEKCGLLISNESIRECLLRARPEGVYVGVVVDVNLHTGLVTQSLSNDAVALHNVSDFEEPPQLNSRVAITYRRDDSLNVMVRCV